MSIKTCFSFLLFLAVLMRPAQGQAVCDTFYHDLKTEMELRPWTDPKQYLSMIGLYREALIEDDTSGRDGQKFRDLFPFIHDSAEKLIQVEIPDGITGSIRAHRGIIINEAYNLPRSRANLYGMVDYLKGKAYKHIFMEGLAWGDTMLQRQHVLSMNAGFYTNEVVYGDLVRKLLSAEITMHPYGDGTYHIDTATAGDTLRFVSRDYPEWIDVPADSFLLSAFYSDMGRREVSQALLIYQQLLHDHIGKYIVYCGYGHGSRSSRPLMGNVLRHLTGDENTVIDQTFLHESSSSAYDYDIYTQNSGGDHPMLLMHADSTPLVIRGGDTIDSAGLRLYDYYILSPPTQYVGHRPRWQDLGGQKHLYPLLSYADVKLLPTDYLVIVYYRDEYAQLGHCAVPADVIQVTNYGKGYDLVLMPDRKYVLTITKGNQTIWEKNFAAE